MKLITQYTIIGLASMGFMSCQKKEEVSMEAEKATEEVAVEAEKPEGFIDVIVTMSGGLASAIEGITDKDSGEKAMGKIDDLIKKYTPLIEKNKAVYANLSPEKKAELEGMLKEKMLPVQAKMQEAMVKAMPVFTENKDLMMLLQEKMGKLAEISAE